MRLSPEGACRGHAQGSGLDQLVQEQVWAAGPGFAGLVHQPASGLSSPSLLSPCVLGLGRGVSAPEGPPNSAPSV